MLKAQLVTVFKQIYAALPPPLRRSFWSVLALAIVAALAEFFLAGLVSMLGLVLATPQTITQSSSMRHIVACFPWLQPVIDDPRLLLALVLGGLCVFVLVKTLLLAFLTWRQSRFSQFVGREFGIRMFAGYLHAPYLWHTGQKISYLGTVLSWRSTLGIFLFSGLQVVSQLFVTGILIVTISVMAPLVSAMILSITGTCAWLVFRFSRSCVYALGRQSAQAQQDSGRTVHTSLNGIREVMIYQQQETFIAQYADAETRLAHVQGRMPLFAPLPSWVLEWLGTGLLLGTVLILYWQGAGLAQVSATLALLAAIAWRLLPVMNRVIQNLIAMQQQLPMLEPVLTMLAELDRVTGSETVTPTPCPLHHELRLEDASFRYPSADKNKQALQNLNLRIPKGSMVGLIGPSGAGKSTVVGLLTGLYLPTQGSLCVDGHPLTAEQLPGWMQGIGYVPQSPFLLNATILENVAFSQWGKLIDRDRALRCCHMAAMNFLDELPDGIDTEIGERGVRLSGGQIQRVAIARALYHDPQVLLFDEATSALDGASEEAIQHTINNLSGQVTMIVVAHRLTTVEKCDFIYWIEDGSVRMAGRPETVLPAYKIHLQQLARSMQREQ